MTITRVLWIVFFLNAAVSATKLVFGYSIESISMVADGYHSATDAAMNLAGLAAIAFALRPPDEDHPYGHRKIETIASLFVGVVLLLVAYEIVGMGVARWNKQTVPTVSGPALLSLVGTIVINAFVVFFEGRAGHRLRSDFLLADAAQTRGDIAVSSSVLLSLWAVRAGYPAVDLLVAAVIAIAIVFSGTKIFSQSIAVLVDRIAIEQKDLEQVIRSIAGVEEIRRIRTRGRPDHVFVDVEIAVAPNMTVAAGHEIAHRVERVLKEHDPRIRDVVVHVEPK